MEAAAEGKPGAIDEAAILARFAPEAADPVGLVAYGLHRRALIGFRAEFERQHARAATAEEEAVFMIGEISEHRIAAYRASAASMASSSADFSGANAVPAASPASASGRAPKRKPRWPWFGMWVDAPMAPASEPERLNWRGLFWRLLTLLLAVITTAILLRALVVKP